MIQISPIIISLAAARSVTETAAVAALAKGIPCTITVVDGAGHLVMLTRMDGAALAAIETSIAKARTSVYFAATTLDLADKVADGQPLATIQTSASVAFAFVAGRSPIRDAQGAVIGAIGVGGGTPTQDHEISAIGVASLS